MYIYKFKLINLFRGGVFDPMLLMADGGSWRKAKNPP